jgi:integrase
VKAVERRSLGKNQGSLFRRDGSPYWYLYISVHGKDVIESTGVTDFEAAKKIHAERIKDRVGDERGHEKFSGPGLKRLKVDHFLDALASYFITEKKKSGPKQISHMKPLRAHFGHVPAVNLTKQSLEAYVAMRRGKGRSDSTINRELQALGQALRMEVRDMSLPRVPKIPRLPGEADNAREGFLEPAEFTAVVGGLPEYLQDFTRFAYATGWRKGEIVSLKWSAVNRVANVITLPRAAAKTKKVRTVPIEGDLIDLIARRWEARVITREDGATTVAERVFHHAGQPIGDFRKSWASACTAAGVKGKLFHDLRRTAVRDMVNGGVREKVAMETSGHKTRSIFDRYHIVDETDKREALRKRQAHVSGAPAVATVAVLPVPRKKAKG